MSEQHTFRAVIQQAGGGAFVTIPFDVERAFGKKRVPVRASIEGEPYRGVLVRMGGPDHILIVLKQIRERIGKQAGAEVEVTVEEDLEPRVVEVPPDLRAALAGRPEALGFFESLAYTHRKEYVSWIEEAKREQTRADRIARAVEMLAAGRKAR
jgi:hypothetical protein